MAVCLLQPWLTSLCLRGYEVHVACARGGHWAGLQGRGYITHAINIRRSFNPLANLRSLAEVYRLLKTERFDVVNVHSPVAAAVARIAALLIRHQRVVYTVHGFYFQKSSSAVLRWSLVGMERWLGRSTCGFMFVSDEDRKTALQLGIAKTPGIATTIYNGVDLDRFRPRSPKESIRDRDRLGLPRGVPIIGIVARIAKEKGYREFLSMADNIRQERPEVRFVVVGDSLPSDRDRFCNEFRLLVRKKGLADQFIFTGFTDKVPEYLRAMDIFVLPSYREGFPVSILEAMATGLPVVTSDIRGCREAVQDGQTGIVVPPKDVAGLTEAVLRLLKSTDLANEMGAAGRRRACELFGQSAAQSRFVSAISNAIGPDTADLVTV